MTEDESFKSANIARGDLLELEELGLMNRVRDLQEYYDIRPEAKIYFTAFVRHYKVGVLKKLAEQYGDKYGFFYSPPIKTGFCGINFQLLKNVDLFVQGAVVKMPSGELEASYWSNWVSYGDAPPIAAINEIVEELSPFEREMVSQNQLGFL